MYTLCFDIGNSNIKVGIANESQIITVYSFPSHEKQSPDDLGLKLLQSLEHANISIDEISFCAAVSVVPELSSYIKNVCLRYLGKVLHFAPKDLEIPLENKYERPLELGADRLLGAYAAKMIYPDAPAVISVDFGTATTFDCVEGNAYVGGLICPGLYSSLKSLAANTARLPQIHLEYSSSSVEPGKSTVDCLSRGFIFGFASMAEGLCAKLSEKLVKPVKIVGVGNLSSVLQPVTSCFDIVKPYLLLEGLLSLSKQK